MYVCVCVCVSNEEMNEGGCVRLNTVCIMVVMYLYG